MNGQFYFKFYINAAFRDAAGRVLENVLTQFEELSKDDLEKLLNTNVKFLVNDHMRNITNNTLQKDIESFDYTKGLLYLEAQSNIVQSNTGFHWIVCNV
jgi:hypothetical protein